jgi:hypothetical protein
VDVGIEFNGKAPDLGAFESVFTTDLEPKRKTQVAGIRVNPIADNSIKVEYNLPRDGFVKLALFELSGKQLFETDRVQKTRGQKMERFAIGPLKHGLYIFSLDVDGAVSTGTVVFR